MCSTATNPGGIRAVLGQAIGHAAGLEPSHPQTRHKARENTHPGNLKGNRAPDLPARVEAGNRDGNGRDVPTARQGRDQLPAVPPNAKGTKAGSPSENKAPELGPREAGRRGAEAGPRRERQIPKGAGALPDAGCVQVSLPGSAGHRLRCLWSWGRDGSHRRCPQHPHPEGSAPEAGHPKGKIPGSCPVRRRSIGSGTICNIPGINKLDIESTR